MSDSDFSPRILEDGLGDCPECDRPPIAVVSGESFQVEIPLSGDTDACYRRDTDTVFLHATSVRPEES